DESLEYLDERRAGRAHNDYLELVVESGVVGIVLALGWIGWLGRRGWSAVKGGIDPSTQAAGLAIGVILVQSITDYPLRNQALLCVAAFMVNLLGRSPRGSPKAADV
ncbi:MAG: hypothetical protein KUG65_02530, partial [Sphingomonadaceae bacterium]|nr:hypothetical protein [Sphingomonadaceae bacterium]